MRDEHDTVRDLVAAYVLGAVDPSEAATVTEHLAGCADCRALEGELREVEAALPSLAAERTPPPALKARLMAIVEAEARGAAAPTVSTAAGPTPSMAPPGAPSPPQPSGGPAAAAPAVVEPLPLRPPTERRMRPLYPLLAIAAALVLALAGVAVWRALNPAQLQPTRQYAVSGTRFAPSIHGTLKYYKDGKRIELDLSGLRRLAPGRVYELWLIRTRGAGAVTGVTIFRPDANGSAHVTRAGYDVPAYNLAGLTVERSFALRPTLPIGATAKLS